MKQLSSLTGRIGAIRIAVRPGIAGMLALALAACNSGSSSADRDQAQPAVTHAIGGSVAGLSATGLVLQNNGSDDLAVAAGADTFHFATPVASGGAYSVTVLAQPAGQTCTVGNGAGSHVAADVADIAVVCSTDTYTVGGAVSGLTTSGLVLQNNGADDLALPANASSLHFATPVAHDGSYHVTVLAQPLGLVCTVGNGVGSHVAANVGNVQVTCSAATFPVGGTVSGLTASGLVLQNNGGDNLVVPANATTLEFATPVAFGGSYNVTVLTQPVGQTCTVGSGAGSNVAAAVGDVAIVCSVDTFDIGGSISNLIGSGLVLRNNGADDLSVPASSTSFQFATPVAYGGSYSVTVQQQPTTQTCGVSNGAGTNVSANIVSVGISCVTNTYTIGGTVSGLSGTVVLQNNGSDDYVAASDGSFTFSTSLAVGSVYNVTVLTQPPSQTCTIGNGSGTVVSSNITNVDVNCSASAPTLSNVSPSTGSTTGGTSVALSGSGFSSVTSVNFDGIPATGFTVNSDTSITVVTPAHAAGAVDVTVSNSGGSGTLSNGFTYQ